MSAALNPCPFCGAGTTQIVPNGRVWTGMKWGEPTSVSVRHWCAEVPGQPSRMIERVGRDEASAIEAWNRRAAPEAQPVATFDDPRVQIVYAVLCDGEAPPDPAEHWEGWVARRIVDALAAPEGRPAYVPLIKDMKEALAARKETP